MNGIIIIITIVTIATIDPIESIAITMREHQKYKRAREDLLHAGYSLAYPARC